MDDSGARLRTRTVPRLLKTAVRRLPRIGRSIRIRLLTAFTYLWRSLMVRTTVIAITGSTGKTTTKECLAAILRSHGATMNTIQNQNDVYGVPPTLRRMRPWHRFAVIEVGVGAPGDMRRLARLVRPDIAIVLGVGRTHTNRFPTLDHTAAEKGVLLEYVSRRGLALLNGDDPRVDAMASRSAARVLRFGMDDGCDYRSTSAVSQWPGRLRFELEGAGFRVPVRTQLVGRHWVRSVVAALAAAEACGLTLTDGARRVEQVLPFAGRMQPVGLPSGAVVIRDEENGSPDTLEAMVDVLRESRATRRGLVFSDLSDSKASPRKRLRNIGQQVAAHCDFAAFIGSHAHHAVNAAVKAGMDPAVCRDFVAPRDAADWLKRWQRPGDLIFIKGRGTDHLSRIVFAQFGDIGCWKNSCQIHRLCDVCNELRPEFDLGEALSRPLRLVEPAA